jgi:membrane associated rhomboid family serine protease
MDTNAIKQDIIKSDMMRIFIGALSLFTLLIVVKIYYGLNGEPGVVWMNKFFPFITVNSSALETITKPWVLISHMFVETDIFGLFSNFLWLWLFGFIVEDLRGQNRVLPLFVVTGLICGVLVIVLTAINTNSMKSSFYFGMRNSIIAIAASAVFLRPTYKVFQMFNGGFSLWILGVVFLLLDLSTRGAFDLVNLVAIFASVGIGYLFNGAFGDWIQNKVADFYEWLNNANKPKPVKIKSADGFRVIDISEDKLNQILDKIHRSGIKSLTANEKEWLQHYNDNK